MDSDAEDQLAYPRHCIHSDSESDSSGGKSDFDDEYEVHKSPPLPLHNGEYNIIEIEPFENVNNKKYGKKLQSKLYAHCIPSKSCKKSKQNHKNVSKKPENPQKLHTIKTSTSKKHNGKNSHENKCLSVSSNIPICGLKLKSENKFTSSIVNQNVSYSSIVKSCDTSINCKLLTGVGNLNKDKTPETQQAKKKKRKKKSAANSNQKQNQNYQSGVTDIRN